MLHCQFVKEFVNVSEIELFVIMFNFMLIIVRFSKKKKNELSLALQSQFSNYKERMNHVKTV